MWVNIWDTTVSANSFWGLWGCCWQWTLLQPHQTTQRAEMQRRTIHCKAAAVRCLSYFCIFSVSFSNKMITLWTSCVDWNNYFTTKLTQAPFLFLILLFTIFCSLTCFAGLAVWGRARGSGWRRGGSGGHSLSLVPFLRTTLRGLDAFDSPGMAISFVMGFCLAL